jgi:acetylglutamate kinase
MAFEEAVELVSAATGADLSASTNMFRVVKLDNNGNAVLAAAITDIPFGILYDTGLSGKVVPVAVGGIAKCLAGGTIPAGSPVATKADGSLQVAATTQYVIGQARTSAVSGDVFSVNISTANVGIKA